MDAITLDNLLRHTSGLGDYLSDRLSPETNDRVLDDVKRSKKLLFPPGTDFRYSNTGYNILASAVARVSGQPFPLFMSKEIFGPIGMTNTLVCTNLESLSAIRAVGYHEKDGQFDVSDYTLRTFGDGGIFRTLNDMKAWCMAIETHRLLRAEKQEQLFTPTILQGAPAGSESCKKNQQTGKLLLFGAPTPLLRPLYAKRFKRPPKAPTHLRPKGRVRSRKRLDRRRGLWHFYCQSHVT